MMAKGIATRYVYAGRESECLDINGLRFSPKIRFKNVTEWTGIKRNSKGEILYAQPGRECLATEKELREFHAERLRD